MILGLLLAVLIFNLFTATRYPDVWNDEVMFTDPAANLALGKGFTSTVWYDQTGDQFFAGNVPLYSLTLSAWIRAFGFTPAAVRSINYVLFTLGAVLIWCFCARARLVENSGLRLLMVILLATGSGVSFSYRSGRYDMLGFFLASAALVASTMTSAAIRYGALFIVGFLFPWAGLPLLPLLAIGTILILIFWGIKPALACIWAGAGAIAGLVGLYTLYQAHHVWPQFVASVTRHTVGSVAQSMAHGKIAEVPAVLARDRSAPFLFVLCALLAVDAWKSRDSTSLKVLLFALAANLGIALGLDFTGMFPIYYGWMVAVPVIIALCHVLALRPHCSASLRATALVLVLAAASVGLPFRTAIVLMRWKELPYSALETFVASHVNRTDRVVISDGAFYPAKWISQQIFGIHYLENAMKPAEKSALTALIIDPDELGSVAKAVGGNWKPVADFRSDAAGSSMPSRLQNYLRSPARAAIFAPYHLTIYRRIQENTNAAR